ncbi:DUF357 domain-containing protein [Methanoregula sp. UBA64]|jgi:uncharacterized protein|uniref:DUF357 domain-containing protein n=1 Tax=Methanoregula sp. UBA64 TaxID=1915554 RepID=UPI0025DE34C3|nr:DUF357 domain-containing protein [Methanoregula sp. UBA64]
MLIGECGTLLKAGLSGSAIVPPKDTPLGALGATIKGMVQAYADDGAVFAQKGDPINALASYYYGFGWLHFGMAYGLLAHAGEQSACPFTAPTEKIPPSLTGRLTEKTGRYLRLLDTACSSVARAPDKETAAGAFADRVLCAGTCYARHGSFLVARGEREEALASFSYGHGWIDAGVRAGLFAVTANREIFTI